MFDRFPDTTFPPRLSFDDAEARIASKSRAITAAQFLRSRHLDPLGSASLYRYAAEQELHLVNEATGEPDPKVRYLSAISLFAAAGATLQASEMLKDARWPPQYNQDVRRVESHLAERGAAAVRSNESFRQTVSVFLHNKKIPDNAKRVLHFLEFEGSPNIDIQSLLWFGYRAALSLGDATRCRELIKFLSVCSPFDTSFHWYAVRHLRSAKHPTGEFVSEVAAAYPRDLLASACYVQEQLTAGGGELTRATNNLRDLLRDPVTRIASTEEGRTIGELYYARALVRTGRRADALASIQAALARQDVARTLGVFGGLLHIQDGEIETGRRMLEDANEFGTKTFWATALIAECYLQAGNLNLAPRTFAQLREMEIPSAVRSFVANDHAVALSKLGLVEESRALLAQAIQSSDSSSTTKIVTANLSRLAQRLPLTVFGLPKLLPFAEGGIQDDSFWAQWDKDAA